MQLKKIFSALYNIDFIAAESLVEEPDIIFSNTYQNRSAIYMSGAIDSLEIERLTKKIESIRREHILQENVIVFSQQVVSAVFENHESAKDISV